MSQFEYLSVLISIVIGLGISHLLAGAARLVRSRRYVRLHGPSLLWMVALFLAFVQIWWTIFERRDLAAWTFVEFVLVLTVPVLVYLLSFLLVPDFEAGESIDLASSYHDNRRWFFGILALVPIASLAQEYVITGTIRWGANPVFLAAFLLIAAAGLVFRQPWVHRLIALLVFATLAAYIGALFFRLV